MVYRIYSIIALMILSLIQFGCYSNMKNQRDEIEDKTQKKCEKQASDLAQKYQKLLAEQQIEMNKVSANYETEKAKQKVSVETVVREVQKIVDRPVYLNHCFDDDGLQQLNSLITSHSE